MVEYEILDNNIKLYKIQNRNVDTIGLGVFVNIGSIYEEKDKRGISHLLEHMCFKTNYKYSAEQIDMGLELNGGISNAFTYTITTGYISEFIPESYNKIIDILYTIIDNKKYLKDEFEKEKKVVLSEINRNFADPSSRLYILASKSVYGDSDYGDPVGGYEETINNIELNDIEEFKYKYYNPENIFILLEGNYNEKILNFIKEKFSKLESNNNLKIKDPNKSKGDNIIEKRDTQGLIYYSINKNYDIKDYIKLESISNLLSGGVSSKTFQIFRNKYGIGYHIDLNIDNIYNDEFIFSLFIPGFESDKEKYLENAIDDLLNEKIDNDYIEGRIKHYNLIYNTKVKNNIFKRLFSDGLSIKLFNKDMDELHKEVLNEMKNYNNNKNLLNSLFNNGKEFIIYPNE